MKKLIALLFCLLLALPVLPALAEQAPDEHASGDFTYVLLDDGTARIKRYNGKAETLELPDELDGIALTSIGDRAFYYCDSLMSVTLPDSVTDIGINPFERCECLTDIVVSPDHPALAVIDGMLISKPDQRLVCYPCAFTAEACTVPQGVQILGVDAFYDCSELTTIALPDSVTSISSWAFSACSGLTSITLPDSVTSIGNSAFIYCDSLTTVTLPDSITSIGDGMFWQCFSLTSINVPDSVTSIGDSAFYQCTGLTSITLPESVASIGRGAFSGCSNLTLTVGRDSCAAQYCEENGLRYNCADSDD